MESAKMPLNPLITVLVIGLIGAAFVIGALWQRTEKLGQQAETPSAESQKGEVTGQEANKQEVSTDDDPVIGDPNAPVTIIEFSDFQCPYCASFAQNTFPQLKKEYIDTGKVRLVYKDLPLPQIGHRNAQKAAEAAECAADQDKFENYHDKLFDNQAEWAQESDPIQKFKDYAAEVGLTPDFDTCLDNGTNTQEVQKDAEEAGRVGIRGTPSFLVGKGTTVAFDTAPTRTDPFFYLGDKKVGVAGAQGFDVFKEIIEPLL